MTNPESEILPEVPVTDNEVGVEMIFLDAPDAGDGEAPRRESPDRRWEHPAPRFRPLTA